MSVDLTLTSEARTHVQEEIIEAPSAAGGPAAATGANAAPGGMAQTPHNGAHAIMRSGDDMVMEEGMEGEGHPPLHTTVFSDLEDGDQDTAGGDDWKHAVHDMFVLVAQQQACADRSPCLAMEGPDGKARGLRDEPRHRQPAAHDGTLQSRGLALNASEQLVHQFVAQQKLTTAQTDALLELLQNVGVEDVGFSSSVGYKTRVASAGKHDYQLRQVDLRAPGDPGTDGTHDMVMWYRPVIDIIDHMISASKYAHHMDWTFHRTVDQSGVRVFTKFSDSMWYESVSAQVRCTMGEHTHVVPVVVGSDSTLRRKRAGAHPVYISIGSLHASIRRKTSAWLLAGFIPILSAEKMGKDSHGNAIRPWRLKQRRREVHNKAVFTILEGLIAHYEGQGAERLCGDGVLRRVVYVFAQYITDRQEHEAVLYARAHTCFHCDCPVALRWQLKASSWPSAQPKHGQQMRVEGHTARHTGAYDGTCTNMHVRCMDMWLSPLTCMSTAADMWLAYKHACLSHTSMHFAHE